MYVSLYRRYRPQKFSDMVGQSAAVNVLKESLKEGHLGHAYLFSGPRGCGKTSAARLVAKGLNCQNPTAEHEPCGECQSCRATALGEHLDVLEIDGASNRGINEIRDLKSHVNLKPLSAEYKIYIIDEVHMLTEAAFNALLKTLEEPPSNVVFLLATTEPHKVPVTIRSRCQHIPFHRISMADMVKRITYVCECENIEADIEAIWEIARQADGALRDSLSLAEQAVSLGKGSLTLESVKALMGGSNRTELEKWVTNLRMDPRQANTSLQEMLSRGISIERFTESLFAIFRDLWIFSLWGEGGIEALEISGTESMFLQEESGKWSLDQLKAACMLCNRIMPRTRYGMRLEVFSGLIMIEMMNIVEGNFRDQNSTVSVVKSAEAKKFTSSDVIPPAEQHYNVPSALPESVYPGITVDNGKLINDFGDNDFSRLISKLGNKSLAIGAALLNCDLVRSGEGWDIIFPALSPSESYLSVSQNRKQLGAAISELWDLRDSKARNNSAEVTQAPILLQTDKPESDVEVIEQKKVDGAIHKGAERVIRMMGAEVLYVKDANSENDDE